MQQRRRRTNEEGKERTNEEEKTKKKKSLVVWFYGMSTCVGYLIHFYANSQFYFKQLSLAWVHSLIVKNISISSYSV